MSRVSPPRKRKHASSSGAEEPTPVRPSPVGAAAAAATNAANSLAERRAAAQVRLAGIQLSPYSSSDGQPRPPNIEAVKVFYASGDRMELLLNEIEAMRITLNDAADRDRGQKLGMSWNEQCEVVRDVGRHVSSGERIVEDYLAAIRKLKMVPFGPQAEIVQAVLSANIAQIFGEEYESKIDYITNTLGIRDHRSQLLVSMPRRNGKTAILSACEAALQYAMMKNGRAGGETAIFAFVLNQSETFLRLVRTRLLELHDGDVAIFATDNARMLRYSPYKRSKSDTLAGVIRAFSGSSDAARGFKANRILFDEASSASKEFVNRNVFAGMLLKFTSLVMISSPPLKTSNIFARMFNAQWDDGRYVFKRIKISLFCDACEKMAGVMFCPHRRNQPRAEWLIGSAGMDVIEQTLGRIDPLAYQQEIAGVMGGGDHSVFPEASLQQWKRRPRVIYTDQERPDYLYVTVDTSGGAQCETGVCAVAPNREDEGFVVRFVSSALFFRVGTAPTGAWIRGSIAHHRRPRDRCRAADPEECRRNTNAAAEQRVGSDSHSADPPADASSTTHRAPVDWPLRIDQRTERGPPVREPGHDTRVATSWHTPSSDVPRRAPAKTTA